MKRSLLEQNYVPLRKIAEGGMGEIFLARQTGASGFQREVVLKRMRPQLGEHSKAVEMFLHEARLAMSLTHANVVQIYDVREDDGQYVIVMEHVDGTNLRELAEINTRLGHMIPMELAVNVIAQVLEGLRYAHTVCDETGRPLKIVHRDIGPNNILISYDGVAKILDFGIARAEDHFGRDADVRSGKYAYMSPEAVRGGPVDARSDLFSVGILLYELTVGHRLFRASSLEQLRQLVDTPIPPPTFSRAGYPVDLEILVMRALEIDPDDRFPDAEAMLEALEQFAFDTGLRISRLRLGRFVAKSMGRQVRALPEEEEQAGDEPQVDGGGEELDFDSRGIFARGSRRTVPADDLEVDDLDGDSDDLGGEGDPEQEVHELEELSQVTIEPTGHGLSRAITAEEVTGALDENKTVEIRTAEQNLLRERSALPDISRPRVAIDGSAVIVSDEQVEEELDLLDPAADLIREPPLSELGSDGGLELEELRPAGMPAAPPDESMPAQAAGPTRVLREPEPALVLEESSPEAALVTIESPPAVPLEDSLPEVGAEGPAGRCGTGLRVETSADAPEPVPALQMDESVPEASVVTAEIRPDPSPDLLAALAEISAELRAGEDSDRRRGEALVHHVGSSEESAESEALAIARMGQARAPEPQPAAPPAAAALAGAGAGAGAGAPAVPDPPAAEVAPAATDPSPALPLSGAPPAASAALASPPVPEAARAAEPSRPTEPPKPLPVDTHLAPATDELELTDGPGHRSPDELELSDLHRPRLDPAATDWAGSEMELEAEGDPIEIQPDESAVEVMATEPAPLAAPVRPSAPPRMPPIPPAVIAESAREIAASEPPSQKGPEADDELSEAGADSDDDEGLDAPTLVEISNGADRRPT